MNDGTCTLWNKRMNTQKGFQNLFYSMFINMHRLSFKVLEYSKSMTMDINMTLKANLDMNPNYVFLWQDTDRYWISPKMYNNICSFIIRLLGRTCCWYNWAEKETGRQRTRNQAGSRRTRPPIKDCQIVTRGTSEQG